MNPLRALDDAVVPATARGLRRAGNAVRHAPVRALRRLDGRVVVGGPLGLVRDVPQLGLVAIALLLVAGSLGAIRVGSDRASAGERPAAPPAPSPLPGCASGTAAPGGAAYVGPPDAGSLAAYVGDQNALLTACAAAAGPEHAVALVSLPAPVTPNDAASALRGVTAATAYVVIKGQGTTPYALPLSGAHDGTVAAAISAAYAAAQAQFEQDRSLEQSQADSIPETDPEAVAGVQGFVDQANADEAAAGQLRATCACVYGALVTGSVRQLAALRTGAVRLVALAPAGAVPAKVTARPLLPSETTALSQAAAPVPVVAGDL